IGDTDRRLPNTACLRFAGADGEAVVTRMDPVAVSLGSACHAGSIEPSPTMLAMGMSRDAAFEAVRFSLGRFTTDLEIELASEKTVAAVGYVREMTGVTP
ncbi:MAG: cysteine desulfurase, partial [Acidobacteria bacterium]|nr:cysteine desulfurase [Acidobacteriota bacterium]